MSELRRVEVADVLEARDMRVALQRELLKDHGMPMVSLTMNIAGSIKVDAWIELAFHEAVRRIDEQLRRHGVRVLDVRTRMAFTGYEQIWVVDAPALSLKAWMCAVEDADALGRLMDADVLDATGIKVERVTVGGSPRQCLICGKPVQHCARARVHTAETLYGKAHEIIEAYFSNRAFSEIGRIAERALLYEAATTPKPGLVDCADNGAHTDMDLFTFIDSASALREDFVAMVRTGWETRHESSEATFRRLRHVGQCAESHMRAVTGGINTHKGAIFSLGLLCAAAGRGLGLPDTRENLLSRAADLARWSLADLEKVSEAQQSSSLTGGERQYVELGLTGVRGEAAAGFPSVLNCALPAYDRARTAGKSINDAACVALIHLLAVVPDSNVIRRGGMERQRDVWTMAQKCIAQGVRSDELLAFNRHLIEANISPGGCADLLAVMYFLCFYEERYLVCLPDEK